MQSKKPGTPLEAGTAGSGPRLVADSSPPVVTEDQELVAASSTSTLSLSLPPAAAPPVEGRPRPVLDERSVKPDLAAPALTSAMLTSLFTHLPGGVIVIGSNGQEMFANEAGKRLSHAMLLGNSSVAGALPADGLSGSPQVTHGMRIAGVLAGEVVPDVDYVVGVQGESRHRVVQVAFTPLRDEDARVTGVVLTLTDVTERVDGQATLTLAADALAEVTRLSLAREAGTLARKAVTQEQDNRDLTRSNTELEQQATMSRAAGALAEITRETLARIAVTQAKDNRALTRSNTELEEQATISRAADVLAEITRESLARIAVTQAQDNRDLTRSNTELEQQATVSRAADALAEITRETLARIAVTQAKDNRDLTRSNTELEEQATLTRASDALAEITRETLARIAVTQAKDNRDLTRSNTELEHQASLARAADALAEVTRETLAREADMLAVKALSQAQDNRDLARSNTDLEHQATLARVADALAEVTRETLARKAGILARKAVTQAKDNRDLTRSNSGLEQFASVASHDLQEPLRKIQAFGDRLRSVDGPSLSPAGADYLERMQHAAARMQVLINDLLTYARVSAEPPAVTKVDLAAVTRAVLTDLESQVAKCGGRVDVGLLPTIEGDPLRLRQLLQNLISNALKFQRPNSPPVVTISAVLLPGDYTEGADAAWLELTVSDNGIGFEQKHAERIFEVFKRLHGRSAYEGTGIGLALCRQIAEQHGGQIMATGSPGEGATMRVTLPLRQAREVGAE